MVTAGIWVQKRRMMAERIACNEMYVVRVGAKMTYARLGPFHIIHQHPIPVFGPQRRQETEVSTHFPPGMTRHKFFHIEGKRHVMFGVEYM